MKLDKKSKKKVEELAYRFTDNSPPLCEEHMPDGLPIDAPEGIDVSENHPASKFERIVEEESEKHLNSDEFTKSRIRGILRSQFKEIYHEDCDPRSCVECYTEKENESEEEEVPIRMDVPDEFDDIGGR